MWENKIPAPDNKFKAVGYFVKEQARQEWAFAYHQYGTPRSETEVTNSRRNDEESHLFGDHLMLCYGLFTALLNLQKIVAQFLCRGTI